MGLFGIGGFKNNSYGINKQEWKQIKQELKSYNKDTDPTNDISNKDVKELKNAIKSGNLEAYLDKCGDDMKSAMGLSLTGAVDKAGFADSVDLASMISKANPEKVKAHLKADYMNGTPESVEAEYQRSLVPVFSKITVGNEVALNFNKVAADIQNTESPFAELFA